MGLYFIDAPLYLVALFYGVVLLGSFILAGFCAYETAKQETQWEAFVPGIATAFIALVVFYIAVFDRDLPLSFESMCVASMIFNGASAIACLFGILFLIKSRKVETQNSKGVNYAVGGIVFSFLINMLMAHAMASDVKAGFPFDSLNALDKELKSFPAQSHYSGTAANDSSLSAWATKNGYKEFPDYHFKFKIPSSPWLEVNLKAFNPNTLLGYSNQPLNQTFMLVATPASAMNEQQYSDAADVGIETMKRVMQNIKVTSRSPFSVNGLNGYRFIMEGSSGTERLRYVWWMTSQNGYLYQFTLWQPQNKLQSELESNSQQLFEGFQPLAPASPQSTNNTFEEERFKEDYLSLYGYRMEVQKSDWVKWNKSSIPGADFAMSKGNTDFFVVSVPLTKIDLPLDLWKEAFFFIYKLNDNKAFSGKVESISNSGYQGFKVKEVVQNQKERLFYEAQILKRDDRAFYAVAIQDVTNNPEREKDLEDAMKRFKLEKKPKNLNGMQLSQEQKEQIAFVVNRMGEKLFERNDAQKGLEYVKYAYELVPDSATIISNLVAALSVNKQFTEAYKILQANENQISDQQGFMVLKAQILYEIGKGEEASHVYQDFLNAGQFQPQDVQSYSNMLWNLGKKKEALELLNKYSSRASSEWIDTRLQYINMLIESGEITHALQELRKLKETYPQNQNIKNSLYSILQSEGKHEELLKVTKEEVRQGDSTAETYAYQGMSQMQMHQYQEAQQSFESAKQLNPSDESIQKHLDELESLLSYGSLDEVKKIVEPVIIPDSMMHLSPTKGNNSFNSSYYLNSITAYQFIADRPLKRTSYQLIKINSENDLSKFTEFGLIYDSKHERLFVNKLEIKNERGEIIGEKDETKFYIVDDSDSGYASHDKVLHVPVPGIEKGSVIELMYSVESLYPVQKMPYEEKTLKEKFPLLNASVVLTGDLAKINAIPLNGIQFKSENNYKIWFSKNIEAYEDLRYSLSYDRVYPTVKLGPVGAHWIEVGNEYVEMIKNLVTPSRTIQDLAEKITANSKTTDEKVQDVFYYLQDNYSYNAIEFGLRGMIPQKAEDTVKARHGDCKDHALLLYQLLKALGIEAYPMLVRVEGEAELSLPALEQFDHMIVYVPGFTKNHFLDPTNKDTSASYLSGDLRQKEGLILDKDKSRIVQIKDNDTSNGVSAINSKRQIRLELNDLVIEEEVKMTGFWAAWFRSFFKDIPEKDYASDFSNNFTDNSQWTFEKVSVQNLSNKKEDLAISLKYRIPNNFYYVGDKFTGKFPLLWELLELNFENNPSRKAPFRFRAGSLISTQTYFVHDNKFKLDQNSIKNKPEEGKVLSFRIEVSTASEGFWVDSEIKRLPGVFPASDYSKVQNEFKKALDNLALNIILEPKS